MNLHKNDLTSQITPKEIPKDLILIREILFKNCNFEITQPILEAESSEYGACTFDINNLNILFITSLYV